MREGRAATAARPSPSVRFSQRALTRRRPLPRRLLLRRRLLRHLLPPLPLTLLLPFLVSARPLDDRDRRRIAVAQAELDDARVSARAVGKSRSDHLEELRHRLVVANAIESAPASVQRRLLAERHQPIGHAAQLLRLGIGGANAVMADQCRGEIAQQRLTVRTRAIELAAGVEGSHVYALSFSFCRRRRSSSSRGGKLSSLRPKDSPMSASISLISFSDLRPKFLVFSISASVFCTSSPMYLMSAFCRQFAARTESSSSSTGRKRFSLSASDAAAAGASASGSSSKLMKNESWSCRMRAAYATASSGRTLPSVHTSSVKRS